jgi:SHS family lactate transporter-like MFS transporter
MALESSPVEARGLLSGVLQQGYSLGYLFAAVFNLALVPKDGWQVLMFIGAGGSWTIGLIRYISGTVASRMA